MEKYNHKKIEHKWQRVWEKKKLYEATDRSKKPKFYGLIEFPYPSGEGLHVGHIRSNTAMDVISRKRRMEGYEVLYPIGWDAFGLPTENYAIKTGIHPKIVTKKNTDTFRRQLKALGFSFDWSREINTTDPAYYKWTQWIFLQMFKKGLAYKKKMAINWCPKDKIGLANEEVIEGKCERCGTTVEKREKEQWMLAITKYADRLNKDLDTVDFEERIKIQQRNWIGKSEGSEIEFKLDIPHRNLPKKILIGTRNPAKIKMVKEAFPESIGIEFVSLSDIQPLDEKEPEEGNDFRENARKKAEFYFKKTGIPTISTDHILWVEKFPHDGGFIVHARKLANPNSPRATDNEVAKWIENIVYKHGESKAAFHYAIAYSDKSGTIDFAVKQKEYLLQKTKSPKKNEGYVFDRYMKDLETGEFRVEQHFEKGFFMFNEFIRNEFLGIFSEQKIKVFTTRADTLFGATYLVLSPEHELMSKLKDQNGRFQFKIENWAEVGRYITETKSKTDMERTANKREKTGVELKGIKAINPANGEKIPVWIADYVLSDYGTGAIMAVPAHDERDFAFAAKFDLPIRNVIAEQIGDQLPESIPRRSARAIIIKDGKLLITFDTGMGEYILPGGGIEIDEKPEEAVIREIKEETGFTNVKIESSLGIIQHNYFHTYKKNNWQTYVYGFVVTLKDDKTVPITEEESKKTKFEWVAIDEAVKKLSAGGQTFRREALFVERYVNKKFAYTGEGVLINSNNPKIFTYTNGAEAWRQNEPETVRPTIACIIKHWSEDKYLFLRKKSDNAVVLVAGGTEGEDLETAGKREIREETGYLNAKLVRTLGTPIHYRFYSTHGKQNRKALLSPAYFELTNGNKEEISEEESSLHDLVWLTEQEIGIFLAGRQFNPIFWNRFKGQPDYLSGSFDGMESKTARTAITSFVGGKIVTTFKLRDWVFSRQRYWGEPIPVIYCSSCLGKSKFKSQNEKLEEGKDYVLIDGVEYAIISVPEKDLPVKLPNVKNYKPTDTGESPLAAMTKWVNVKCPDCKGPAKRETDTMPNWAGSSWYYLRYIDPKNKKEFAGKKKLLFWSSSTQKLKAISYKLKAGPVDWYNGGMEHTTLHLLYSRFWHKFLFDQGLVPTNEPYAKRTSHGLILAEGGVKMSKSRPDTIINPDKLIEVFGADSLRLYEMFIGPFEQAVSWSRDGLVGTTRFLERVWRLQEKVSDKKFSVDSLQLSALLHKTIKKVTEDIETMKFNTAVSQLMILVNQCEASEKISLKLYETILLMLAPFAPHICEELWQKLGLKKSIHLEQWPVFDSNLIKDVTQKIAVQINGKVRATLETAPDISEKDVTHTALNSPEVKKWLEGRQPKKIIFVKGKILSIVV